MVLALSSRPRGEASVFSAGSLIVRKEPVQPKRQKPPSPRPKPPAAEVNEPVIPVKFLAAVAIEEIPVLRFHDAQLVRAAGKDRNYGRTGLGGEQARHEQQPQPHGGHEQRQT